MRNHRLLKESAQRQEDRRSISSYNKIEGGSRVRYRSVTFPYVDWASVRSGARTDAGSEPDSFHSSLPGE